MVLRKKLLEFCAGGGAYVGMELLFRGRSHSSMFAAGGLSLLLIGHLEEIEPRLPFPTRVLTGAGIITMVELATGLAVNRDYRIWDYRDVPWNYLGQICLPFSLLWVPMSALAGKAYLWLERKLDHTM